MRDTIETAIDRTQILDVEKLWPKPSDCPDWPIEIGTRRHEGRRGRAGALDQMERLGQILNRGGKIHAPTAEEREAAFGRVFAPHGSMFHELGIKNLSALDRTTEDQARLIVQAAHLRGYLRKLDAQDAADAEAKVRRERAEAERTLDGWLTQVSERGKEYAALEAAAARHQQRIDDKKAFDRRREIVINIRHALFPAQQASAKLGGSVSVELPDFVREK